MANATSTELQELYVAYFGRAADPTGLDYWTEKGITTTKFAADMYAQAEFKDAYGSLTVESQVNQIYKNLFDREADVSGLTYWTQQINLGVLKVAEIATHLIWAAKNNSGSEDDKTALTNRTNAAVAYTAEVKLTTAGILAYAAQTTDPWVEGDNIAEAKSYLTGIDKDTEYTAAGITSSVNTIKTNGVQSDKLSFTGTTAVDSFTGGTANDTFTFDNSTAVGTDTTSAADSVDGKGGTDTIKIFSDGGADGIPSLTAVEKAIIYDQDDSLDLSATAQASLTDVKFVRGDGIATFTVGLANTNITLDDFALGTVGIALAHNASDTTSIIGISSITDGSTDGSDGDIHLTGGSLATVTLNVTGTSTFDDFDVAGASAITIDAASTLTLTELSTTSTLATVTVTGAGTVNLGTLIDGVDTFTATGMTSALTMTSAADNLSLVANLGSGADVITTGDTDFVTADAFNIDAGTGTDTLVIGSSLDVDTALIGGRYDNFEVLRSAFTQDMALVSGITGLEVSASTSQTFSEMTAAQLADITILGTITTAVTFTAANNTGSSDTVTLNLTSATTATNITTVGMSFDGIETLNIVAGSGTDASVTTAAFAANAVDEVTDLNISGSADVHLDIGANTFDESAIDIDASALTGTGHFELDVASTAGFVAGSSVTGTGNADTFTLDSSTLGNTYTLGAGNDTVSATIAQFVSTGTNDDTISLGAGTDTITLSRANNGGVTLTDNHFTNVTGAEAITVATATTGNITVTTGGSFTTAFASSASFTATQALATATVTWNGGLYNGDTTITVTSILTGANTAEDITINTGDGADTVTLTASSYTSATADQGSISISTDEGNDTITLTTGNIAAAVSSEAISIDAGAGADTITLSGMGRSTTVQSAANIVVNNGDSTTTAYDKITGFLAADGTDLSMEVQFEGTAAVTDFTLTSNYGTIKSHNLSSGFATFDDIDSYTTALVISSSNLADVCGYLAANTDTNDVTAFLFDATGSGANDSTMLFHNYTTDALVQLTSLSTATALTITTTLTTANNIAIT